jgi:ribosomal-protein-alanine N-acetyltransferase
MMMFDTQRLAIRNFVPEDRGMLREIILEKEASEYAAYDYEFPTSEEEVGKIADWFASGDSFLAVCLKDSNTPIGYIAFGRAQDAEDSAYDLGYCFHPAYQGRGYATEACGRLIAHAFDELGADRITSGTAEANKPSRRLLGRLRFRVTGKGTVSFRKNTDGTPIEFTGLTFELTKAEFDSRRQRQ